MITWEYVAGFVDGEGCIDCREREVGRQFRIVVMNSHIGVLEQISEFLIANGIDSRVRPYSKRYNPKHAPMFALWIGGAKNVYKFLLQLEDHLIVKEDEARIVIEWLWDLAERADNGEFNVVGQGRAAAAYRGLRAV